MDKVLVRALNTFTGHAEGHKSAGDEWLADEQRALELQQSGNVEIVEGGAGADFRQGAEGVDGGDGSDTGERAESDAGSRRPAARKGARSRS